MNKIRVILLSFLFLICGCSTSSHNSATEALEACKKWAEKGFDIEVTDPFLERMSKDSSLSFNAQMGVQNLKHQQSRVCISDAADQILGQEVVNAKPKMASYNDMDGKIVKYFKY